MNRREFMRTAFVGIATLILQACGVRTPTSSPTAPSTAGPGTSPAPSPAPGATATQTPRILKNENLDEFYVRYAFPFPAPDRQAWSLTVEGLVEKPGEFDYQTVQQWNSVSQVSRLKCVECWSGKAKWDGFTYATLADIVKPLPAATYVRFECLDSYYEVLSVEELSQPRVLFVLKMNDQLLPDEYGAPLRMIIPSKYGYKGAKAVNRLIFRDTGGKGYWSTVGPYSVSGDIQPGFDHPLDLGGEARQINGGEITQY